MFAEIALRNSLFEPFTYRVPEHLRSVLKEGFAVYVPVRRQVQVGFVTSLSEKNSSGVPEERLRDIIDIFPLNPVFDRNMFQLLMWASDYYIEPPGSMLFSAVPSGIFKLSNFKVKLNYEDSREEVIGLSRLFKKKGTYKISMLDLFRRLSDGTAQLFVEETDRDQGSVVELSGEVDEEEIKRVSEKYPVIDEILEYLRLKRVLPLYEVLSMLRDKRILRYLYKSNIIRIKSGDLRASSYSVEEGRVIELNEEQLNALKSIERISESGFGVHYLYGVTGSGKTEIYLRAAKGVLNSGKSVLFLVPEIGLTPQSIYRIRSSLMCDVAVLHSGLYEKERIQEYLRIKNGEVKVVVGARSAIFAPLRNVGMIVVDEEHDTAYKQEESPRYNGRDMAIKRGQIEGCVVVLGSATPSIQSIYSIKTGKFSESRLTIRANNKPLPEIDIVSLSRSKAEDDDVEGLPFYISDELYRVLIDTINNNNKAILMLNRRGFNTFILCRSCGYVFKCPDCDIHLVYHRQREMLLCHYCGYNQRLPDICPNCSSLSISKFGFGTEQVEETIKRLIPSSRTVRLDRDSISNMYDLENAISRFSKGDANILIGTQMVAKGHHFPDVTLVGVILADMSLSVPDFRVQERLLQLLMQVAGRAGRGSESGKVIIQTFNPFEPAIVATKSGNMDEYASIELVRRKNLFYPPFSRIILIRSRSEDAKKAEEVLMIFKNALSGLKRSEVLGPVKSPIERIKKEFRYQLLIKTVEINRVRNTLKNLIPDVYRLHHKVRVSIDVDPLNML
jgi:primosomal protein N' (replication factor Y)